MNVITILAAVGLFLTSAAAVRLQSRRARLAAAVLCGGIGGSFAALGLILASPTAFAGGAAHLAASAVIGMEPLRQRLTVICGLFAVALSGLILVADAWERPDPHAASSPNDRLSTVCGVLQNRGGVERVQLALIADAAPADFASIGEIARNEGIDAVVLLFSELPKNPSSERLADWTSRECGIPFLFIHPDSLSVTESLRPYFLLTLMGERPSDDFEALASRIQSHPYSAVVAPRADGSIESLAREQKASLLVHAGSDLVRTTVDNLHLVRVGSGTEVSTGGLLETTPYGLVVRALPAVDGHRESAASLMADGRMLLLAIRGERLALGALLLLCILGFAIPLAAFGRMKEPTV